MTSSNKYSGVWPVMLTPFTDAGEIDWASLERLIDWYVAAGVSGLFANCQSSEMFFLSQKESVALTRFVLEKTAGRVPVVASGHTANAESQQIEQLHEIAETGVDSVILISNRLAPQSASDAVVLERIAALTEKVPGDFGLGIYECPYPYKRLLSDDVVKWCATSGRYTFIKDTCCDIDVIRRRLALTKGSSLNIANANTQTLIASLRAGASGYSGVMANYHPELYVWLCANHSTQPETADALARYLTTASLIENVDYPISAKDFQRRLGNFSSATARVREAGPFLRSQLYDVVDQMVALGEDVAKTLGIKGRAA
jgi:4-hydroxy-tetrahydrodipicolinate synthase